MTSLASQRLALERKGWRKDHPHGFVARPMTAKDGSVQMSVWECKIPGKAGTVWEQGLYPVRLEFPDEYPSKPPKVSLPGGFFHPNVYPSGKVCLSILNEEKAWKPSITVKQILMGIQDLLDSPNPASPAQSEAYMLFTNDRADYDRKVKEQALRYPAL